MIEFDRQDIGYTLKEVFPFKGDRAGKAKRKELLEDVNKGSGYSALNFLIRNRGFVFNRDKVYNELYEMWDNNEIEMGEMLYQLEKLDKFEGEYKVTQFLRKRKRLLII